MATIGTIPSKVPGVSSARSPLWDTIWKLVPRGYLLPEDIWQARHRGIVALLWFHVAVIVAFALAQGNTISHSLFEASIVAAIAVPASLPVPSRLLRSLAGSLGLITSSAVLTHLSGGYIEFHFHFFVMLAVIALYQQWIPFLLSILYVLVHHGVFGALDPDSVFNHPDALANPWKWAVIHAMFVSFACAAYVLHWRWNEALREHAKHVLDSAGEGIVGLDPKGNVLFMNPAAERITGYQADKLLGRSFGALADAMTAGGAADGWERTSSHSENREEPEREVGEGSIKRKDGTSIPAEFVRTTLRDRGKVTGAVVTLQDITQRKEAEGALAEAVADRENVMQTIPDIIYNLDLKANVVKWNRKMEEVTDFTPEDLMNKPAAAFFPPGEQAFVLQQIAEAFTKGYAKAETNLLRKDGTTVPYEWTGVPLKDADGNVIGLAGSGRDITERRQAQEALAEAVAERDNIMQTIPDIIATLDMNANLIAWNKRMEEVTGLTPGELMNRPWISLFPLEEQAHVAQQIVEVFTKGYTKTDTNFLTKDGSTIPYEWTGVPLKDAGGNVIGVTGAGRDITERKQAEEALARANAELNAINKELETFSYSVSHDLRAPLRSMAGFSQSLLENYADSMDERGKDYLGRIEAAAKRMGTLIDDLLALSRFTRAPMSREAVDLSGLARTMAAELREAEPERRVEISVQESLVGHADPGLIRVVLQNLLHNAWKFTANHPSARIEFGALRQDGEIVYFVRDDGAGFDATYVDKLFGAFQRLHGTHEFPGTGIGLATAQRIIHRHAGRIWAEGEVEKGATFYFTLT